MAVKVVLYSHLFKNFPEFVVIHTVKAFGLVTEAEVDVFLEFSCFFNDPMDVGNLISGSSAFSKSNLNIWKFLVHILLKPGLKNFEHYHVSILNECSCISLFWGDIIILRKVRHLQNIHIFTPPLLWIGKIPWWKERLPTPVFWPEEFHGLYSP